MLYQLSYARAPLEWWGKDSNLRSAKRGRFTVCSLWPLGHPTAPNSPPPSRQQTPRVAARGVVGLLGFFGSELTKGLEPLTC